VRYPGLGVYQELHHYCVPKCSHPGLRLVDQQCALFGFEACTIDIDVAAIGMEKASQSRRFGRAISAPRAR
jgi:hypothetical protein